MNLEQCPKCGLRLYSDRRGDKMCPNCGIVVDNSRSDIKGRPSYIY